MALETYLNDGLYRKVCDPSINKNISVRNVERNSLLGSLLKDNSVQMNVDTSSYTEKQQLKEKMEYGRNVQSVKKNIMFLDGKKSVIGENIALQNVIGKTKNKQLVEKGTHNTLMEELKNTLKRFIIPQNGEQREKKYTKGTITNVNYVENMVVDYTPIISFRQEFVKIHYQIKTLLPYVNHVTQRCMVN